MLFTAVLFIVHPFKSKWDHYMDLLTLVSLSIINVLMHTGFTNNLLHTADEPYSNVESPLSTITLTVICILLIYMIRAKWSRLKELHHRWNQQAQANELNCLKKSLWMILDWIISLVNHIDLMLQARVDRVKQRLRSFASNVSSNKHYEPSSGDVVRQPQDRASSLSPLLDDDDSKLHET